MTEMSQERVLFREAAELAIRLQNDPHNPVSIDMARAWAARSPEHAAKWARVAEIHGMAGNIFTEQRRGAKLSRRGILLGGAACLGTAAAGSWLLQGALVKTKPDFVTAAAEVKHIILPDGTKMTLGPDSAVALKYTDASRDIDLIGGMGYFEVASEPTRSFTVATGTLTATALGTAFDISNDAGFVSVSVEHGLVDARAPDSDLSAGERISAGRWITLSPSTHDVTRGTRETFQIAAWRDGMIVAERETVAAVIAKIARWVPGRVVVADPWLGARVVSGVFDLQDPARAMEAVVLPFGAKVREIGSVMTIISSV